MRMIDLQNELTELSLMSGRKASTANGSSIDLQGYQGVLKLILNFAAGGGTNPTMTIKVQDSTASGSGFTDVSGLAFAQVVDSASLQAIGADTRSLRRYIRVVATIGGTSPTFDGAVTCVGQKQVT